MKTYSTATYLKVNDKTRANYLCELLSSVLKSAAETVDHVDYDEVRLLPSAGSIYVGLLVQADSAQGAAELAEVVYSSALNLMGEAAEEVSRRQTSLSYA
ncbi:hypothetical protein [Actinomyces oris]|jgi:hypothetical protein|uniref:hypothetical protein n=1 Tax=Actinomyces oris TaxID=544580 RepID=UPI000A69EBB7|nr:hypothetical protein [Actinomyces oris]